MKIGLLSDTHGYLDPRVLRIFEGVDHILHGGDIGPASLIAELEEIAPVTCVLGNTDWDESYRETQIIELGGLKFMVHHIVDVGRPSEVVRRQMLRHQPDVVVFGHTHKAHDSEQDGVRWFNPGYAGKPRFNMPRSVAVAELDGGSFAPRCVDL